MVHPRKKKTSPHKGHTPKKPQKVPTKAPRNKVPPPKKLKVVTYKSQTLSLFIKQRGKNGPIKDKQLLEPLAEHPDVHK